MVLPSISGNAQCKKGTGHVQPEPLKKLATRVENLLWQTTLRQSRARPRDIAGQEKTHKDSRKDREEVDKKAMLELAKLHWSN